MNEIDDHTNDETEAEISTLGDEARIHLVLKWFFYNIIITHNCTDLISFK